MLNQKGFSPIQVLVIIALGIGLIGTGYFLGFQKSKDSSVKHSPLESFPSPSPTAIVQPPRQSSVSNTPTPKPESSKTPSITTPVNGVNLQEIKYTLPLNWRAKIENNFLHFAPDSGGGYLDVLVYDYPGTMGRREFYCQTRKVCIDGTTKFVEMNLGNISGYKAEGLDNSGSGPDYFGAKGNKFYIIGSFSPPTETEFSKNYLNVLNSLLF